jgi:hypothetical protein
MKAKIVVALLLVAALLSLGAKPTPTEIPVSAIGESVLLIGQLGEEIGETVTIEGIKKTQGEGNFKVHSVRGKSHKADLWIDGIDSWPEGTRATFTGRERAFIRIIPIPIPIASNEDSKFGRVQTSALRTFNLLRRQI